MQRNLYQCFFLLALLLTSALPVKAAEIYTLDPHHSYILWHISHFGFSTQSGKWYVQGSLALDRENLQNSKVDVTINVNDMITGIPELDKHLKEKLFFDTETYPTATFVSNKVQVTGKNTALVNGLLTIRGISKPITLNVVLSKEGVSPITNKKTLGFHATTAIKRSEFGMTSLLPGLSDDVSIDIEAEAYLASQNKR